MINEIQSEWLKCYRVKTASRQPVADLSRPWLEPKTEFQVDEFELRQAAIECAQRCHDAGLRVVQCAEIRVEYGQEVAKALEWMVPA